MLPKPWTNIDSGFHGLHGLFISISVLCYGDNCLIAVCATKLETGIPVL